MVKTICNCCDGEHHWSWSEAFEKHGFNGGDGQIETETVAAALTDAGYSVEVNPWSVHNITINSIKLNDVEQILSDTPNITVDTDNPYSYLPEKIIELLNKHFPETTPETAA